MFMYEWGKTQKYLCRRFSPIRSLFFSLLPLQRSAMKFSQQNPVRTAKSIIACQFDI
jgi:hypothetical protein